MNDILKKVNVKNLVEWNHHRFGWNYVTDKLEKEFHTPYGIDLFTNGTFKKFIANYDECDRKSWLAFFHITPSDPFIDKHLSHNKNFHENLKKCKGIFTLSEYSAKFLRKYTHCSVNSLKYPMPPEFGNFCYKDYIEQKNKKIYFIGHWLRNYDDFINLETCHKKILIKCPDTPTNVQGVDFLEKNEYDSIFKNNIVFLSLIDSSANTTILECISNCTPILVNRLEPVEEYLGEKYPLFYDDIKHASNLISSARKIEEAHNYLVSMDKEKLTIKSFCKEFYESDIYKKLILVKI